ncbi:MAG: lysophospholipid acyltransferase family protein [Acidithiobacillales bacterium]
MPKTRSSFRNRLEAGAVHLLLAAARRATPEKAEAVGRTLGRLYRALDGRRRKLALQNLALAYPEKGQDEIEALSVAVFEHFGGMAADVLHAFDEPIDAFLSRIAIEGIEYPRAALASGRGFFFLTPHLGSWEYAALATAAHGFPVSVVGRPLDNPLLDRLVQRLRTRSGNAVIPKADAARPILKLLREGGTIGILADQRARKPDAVIVPFFGRPAATTSSLARLVDRTEALVVLAACIRIAPARYRLRFEPPIDVRTLAPDEREPGPLTARFNREMERLIREHPEQWLWLHNRWRLD